MVDVTRQDIPSGRLYSWWSYRAADWNAADKGRRLDHIWATPDIAGPRTAAASCATRGVGTGRRTMCRCLRGLICRVRIHGAPSRGHSLTGG